MKEILYANSIIINLTIGIVTFTTSLIFSAYFRNNFLLWFSFYIRNAKSWTNVDGLNKKWIYKYNNLYSIEIEDKDSGIDDYSEPWTQQFPDALGSGVSEVFLKYNGNQIKKYNLIHLDGYRYSVIEPFMEVDENYNFWEGKDILTRSFKNIRFFWTKNSPEYFISKIVGDNVEKLSERTHVEIRKISWYKLFIFIKHKE